MEEVTTTSPTVQRNNDSKLTNSGIPAEVKTIFNILSKLKQTETNFKNSDSTSGLNKNNFQAESGSQRSSLTGSEETDDIVILRKDPKTKRSSINKSAYARLHRSLSPSGNDVDKLKEKYEYKENQTPEPFCKLNRTPSHKLESDSLQSIKYKYSPASYGYPKRVSKLPVPKPRLSKSQIIQCPKKETNEQNLRYSLDIDGDVKNKDENSNVLRKSLSSSDEYLHIVRKSDSEESIDRFQKELSFFTMDRKNEKKKRSNSFKKIFTGKFFGKDKKKKEEEKTQNKENGTYTDNIQNENCNFNRQSPYRHTIGNCNAVNQPIDTKMNRTDDNNLNKQPIHYNAAELDKQYAQMHINQFNQIKYNFESSQNPNAVNYTSEDYVPMDKPIFKSNQANTYINMPNIRKYIDTSSSASTLESDRSNLYQNEVLAHTNSINQNRQLRDDTDYKNDTNLYKSTRFNENRENTRDTPPRLQETRQDVRLVNPKALIPINSERPLPNPYQTDKSSLDRQKLVPRFETDVKSSSPKDKPHLEEVYGTVFDSLEYSKSRNQEKEQTRSSLNDIRTQQKPPRSPSFEPTKLKLPPNRDIVPLSPRVRSPIPFERVSTEKIIATELLKPTRSPTPTRKNQRQSSPSHQRLEIDIDYPDNFSYNNSDSNDKMMRDAAYLTSKPPVAAKTPSRLSVEGQDIKRISQGSPASLENFTRQRLSQASPASLDSIPRQRISQASPIDPNQKERITTNAIVHVNSSNIRTPTPSNSLHNLSLSPMRPASIRSNTPVDLRISQSPKTTPQKEDIRKSVEAYYWKEIKKLKEQENYDLYIYQMHNMLPYGYAEDPVTVRRSRSLSPSSHRNSRRSLSLPRDPRPTNVPQGNPHGRIQTDAIPEGRAVVNKQVPQQNVMYGQVQYPQNFRRSTPERRTIDGSSRNYENYNSNSLYRPIFKRGSLNTPPAPIIEESLRRKVSFSRSDVDSPRQWPTKNGFTKSPPQRRIENQESTIEDDVFLPNSSKHNMAINGNEMYGYGYSNARPTSNNIRYTNENVYSNNTRQNLTQPNNNPRNPNENTRCRPSRNQQEEPLYGQRINSNQYPPHRPNECLYGQPLDAIRTPQGPRSHGSIQMTEPLYGQSHIPRRMSYENRAARSNQVLMQEPQYINRSVEPNYGSQRREIIMNDDIFGQFGGYLPPNTDERHKQNPMYSSRQSISESTYGWAVPKQISVRNKVCDIYGQIHDNRSSRQQSGVLMGELYRNPDSPMVVRQSYTQLPNNESFVRNTRLTASANDMYRRLQNPESRYRSDLIYGQQNLNHSDSYGSSCAPTRPLPPVPQKKKGHFRNNLGVSDTESGSNAGEIQRVLTNSTKTKKRSFFGK